MDSRIKYEPNQLVGLWTLIRRRPGQWVGKKAISRPAWLCRCSCGVMRWVSSANLSNGSSTQCGHSYQGAWKSKNVKPVNSIFHQGDHA